MTGRCKTCRHWEKMEAPEIVGHCTKVAKLDMQGRWQAEEKPAFPHNFGCIHHEEKQPELKPCPFCGEAPYFNTRRDAEINCQCYLVFQYHRVSSRDVLAQLWNTRHEPYKERADKGGECTCHTVTKLNWNEID